MTGATDSEIEKLKQIITKYFDAETAKICHILLGCACTLGIKSGTKKVLVIFLTGDASVGKSTALQICDTAMEISGRLNPVHVDNMTTKSWVSSKDGVDLLELLPGKCLFTTDLNDLFSKSRGDLRALLASLVRIIDGVGYSYATAGKITSYHDLDGFYTFVWLGAANPPIPSAMTATSVASRFYYLSMTQPEETTEMTVNRLTKIFSAQRDYNSKIKICAAAVAAFLKSINFKVDSIPWSDDDPSCVDAIAKNAVILKMLRAKLNPSNSNGDKKKNMYQLDSESPERATAILLQIARGLALMEKQTSIQKKHLPLVTAVAISTVAALYPVRALIFCRLIEANGTALHMTEFTKMTKKFSEDWIVAEIKQLEVIGLIEISNNKIKFAQEHENTALDLRQYIIGETYEKIST